MRNTLVFAFIALVLTSCASIPKETPPEIFWPMPPDLPRIKFVDYIRGSRDATGYSDNFLKVLLFGAASEYHFSKPSFAAAREGLLFVTDINRILMFDFKEKKFNNIGTGFFINPTGIDLARDGTLYVGDSARKMLFSLKPPSYYAVRIAKDVEFESIGGLALDEERGLLYVVDARSHEIEIISLKDGTLVRSFGSRGEEEGQFNFPFDVKVDPKGRLFVMDSGNFRVQIFDSEGNFVKKFGSVGAEPGLFARPKGLALDSEGHVYVVDASFGNFQIFDEDGNVYLSVGISGSEPGMHLLPMGITIDERNRIYVVDQLNQRVQIYQYISYAEENTPKKAEAPAQPPAPLPSP